MTVQRRSQKARPRWLRVPWVILRSITTKRMACSDLDPVIGRTFLQRAGSDDRPEAFAKSPPSLASSSLGHIAVHHHETHGLFRSGSSDRPNVFAASR